MITDDELIRLYNRLRPNERACHEFHTGHEPEPPTLFDVLSRILDRMEPIEDTDD